MTARPVTISLAPNASARDARHALRLLARPWRWRRGPETERLEETLRVFFGVPIVHAVSGGRWALAILLRALDLPRGSEVLLQAYTCVSAPGPVLWAGLRPVYVDIHPATATMDPEDLRKKITRKSRVLILQHTFGSPARVDDLLAIARERRLTVIEDCAHTIGARARGRILGTFGDAAIVSFGRDKALSSVFGGALLVSRPERFPGLARELQTVGNAPHRWILQQLLHPILFVFLIRPLYFRRGVGKALLVFLQHAGILSKAITPREKRGGEPPTRALRLPAALASLALFQFGRLDAFNAARRRLSDIYARGLRGTGATLPTAPPGSEPVLLRYTIHTPLADEIRRAARDERILLGDWYDVIAPRDTDLAAVGYARGSCPVAERVAERSLNLPTHPTMTTDDAERVVSVVRPFLLRPPHAGRTEVRDIPDKETWERFVLSLFPNTFLHAWNWRDMHRALGERTVELGAYAGGELSGVALGVTVTARRGRFLFCPHGPLASDADATRALLGALARRARTMGMAFLRVSPLMEDTDEARRVFRQQGFRPAPMHMHAETMWVLDIRPPEAALLAGMRKTTRNLIRRGEREGVTVRMSADEKDLPTFTALYKETAAREGFVAFSEQFLQEEFRAFARDDRVLLFFAEVGREPLAAALIPLYGKTAFYHQGASTRRRPKVPAAVVLQWGIINALKRRGIERYNFWGIVPWKLETGGWRLDSHPWAGLSLFKQGFGGERLSYLHAHDLPLTRGYWLTAGIERLRRWKRGL